MRRKQRKRESTRSKAGKRPWPWNWKLHAELSGCWVNNNKKSQSGACTKRSTAGRWIVKTYDGESNLALPCTDVADLGQCSRCRSPDIFSDPLWAETSFVIHIHQSRRGAAPHPSQAAGLPYGLKEPMVRRLAAAMGKHWHVRCRFCDHHGTLDLDLGQWLAGSTHDGNGGHRPNEQR